MSHKVEQLASQVLLHKRIYYTGQEGGISDEVYDRLEAELRKLAPDHPVLSLVGSEAFSLGVGGKVQHNPPMLSLNKTYVPSEVVEFVKKYGDVCLTLKIDGMSLKVEYGENLALSCAATRGNGKKGENVTPKVMHVPTLPKRLPATELKKGAYTFEVRGELCFPLPDFERLKGELELSSFRNAVAGIIGNKDYARAVKALDVFRFIACDLIIRRAGSGELLSPAELKAEWGLSTQTEILALLSKLGFMTPETMRLTYAPTKDEAAQAKAIETAIADFFDKPGRDLAFDGEVLRANDIAAWIAAGATSHHPSGALAFKRAGDTAVTRILGIEVGTGRTGQISFTAALWPVELSGAEIASATLHNVEFIAEKGIAVGDYVRIIRSGEVIPKVLEKVQEDDPDATAAVAMAADATIEPFSVPTSCLCGTVLTREGPHLFCTNEADCSGRQQEGLVYFLKTIEVKGVADKSIKKLVASGLVKRPGDFFRVTPEQLLALDGFKGRLATKTHEAFQARRSVDLGTFFASLGIPGVGRTASRELAGIFKTVAKMRALKEADLLAIKGYGPETTAAYIGGIVERSAIIDDLLSVMTVEEVSEEKAAQTAAASAGGALSGKVVVITGSLSKPRKEIEKMIEAAGGRNGSSVSSTTTYLVCNEPSGSSKSKKAADLGVKVISEAELLAMLAG